MQFPLFPLRTVLFPDGLLPLRIFEVRYLDMIGRCHEAGTPFGVVCLTEGEEVAAPSAGDGLAREAFQSIGTLALIRQFERPQPGLLMIRCSGGQRFRLHARERQKHGLWIGEAELLEADLDVPIPEDLAWLATRLRQWSSVIRERIADASDMPMQEPLRWNDCGWVANRFSELLPLDAEARQNLMALQNPLLRLELVADVVERMDGEAVRGE